MRIIIEGVDGAGKTTIAKLYANEYGLDYCHCTQYDPADYDFYKNTARKDNVVWDRHTIGELIYPIVFGRNMQISPEDARLALSYARELGAKIFVLTADLNVIADRLIKRGGEDPKILENLAYIDEQFKFFADQYHIPVIDTSKLTMADLFTLATEKSEPYKFVHK